jgi:hypothetical protein
MKGKSGKSRLLLDLVRTRVLTVLTECTVLMEFVYIRLCVVWVSTHTCLGCLFLSWLSLGVLGVG